MLFNIVATIYIVSWAALATYAWRHRLTRQAHNIDNQVRLVLEQLRRNEAEAADVGLTAEDRRWLADVGVAEWP